jgi:hypothetical protein
MANLTLNGLIEKDPFKATGDKEPTIYGKLEVILEKGISQTQTINASDINVDKLENANLLLVRGKDDKYEGNVKFTLNLNDGTNFIEEKLKSTKVLWLSLESKLQLMKEPKQIENLVFELKDEEDESKPVGQVIIEIMVLRRINTSTAGTKGTGSRGTSTSGNYGSASDSSTSQSRADKLRKQQEEQKSTAA